MKTPSKILLTFVLVVFSYPLILFTQNNPDIRRTYHWYFGNGAGIDFSNGTAVAETNSSITTLEGCASISDTCGNLLFYTDGDTVWDKNNNVMPNGTGLMGCNSSTQSSLIIPQPENDSLYYIFLTDCGENLGANGLRYSIVNINLNGGLGEVIQKNTLLYAPASEKLAATYHANKTDIWVISVNRFPPPGPWTDTTMQYIAYLLTGTGIDAVPVISSSSVPPPIGEGGYLRFSHSGDKIAHLWLDYNGSDTLEIANFDAISGLISNSILIYLDDTNVFWEFYGLIFSQDDSKLYISSYDITTPYPAWSSKIYQYNISIYDSATIASSRTLIHYSDSTNPDLPQYMAMQVGSDGRIYIASINNTNDPTKWYPDTIGVITNPDLPGLACNFIEKGMYIGGGSQAGLPNFVDSYFRGTWQPTCDIGIEDSKSSDCEIQVYPNPFSDYTTIHRESSNKLEINNMYLQLYDFSGNIILQSGIKTTDYKIFKGNLNKGIYFLKINTEKYTYTKKLIIN